MNTQVSTIGDRDDVLGHYINGKHVSDRERLQPVSNPATGKNARWVAMANTTIVADAVAAAQAAFAPWRDTPPVKRAQIMFRYKQLLEENADAVVQRITEEHGKILNDALGAGVTKRGAFQKCRAEYRFMV